MIKFKFLTGDCNWQQYGAKWVSNKLNNGEFDYWFVLELINWEEATGELNNGRKYNVSLFAVSPSEAGEKNLESAFECCGIDENVHQISDLIKVEALHSYGVYTPIWSEDGNNANKLLKLGKGQAKINEMMFGFSMDRTVNKIGTTGWESLKGDMNSALRRCAVAGNPEQKLVAKISGYVAA